MTLHTTTFKNLLLLAKLLNNKGMDRRQPGSENLYTLRLRNREDLARIVFNTPIAAVGYDIDGTVRMHGKTDPDILRSQANMLALGMIVAGMSARGESAYAVVVEPLIPILKQQGLNPEDVPFFMTTRNGACTEQPFAGKIIDGHPLSDSLYERIVHHPLVEAIAQVTPQAYIDGLTTMYEEFEKKLGVTPDARVKANPAFLHDRHRIDGQCYKLTMHYAPQDRENGIPSATNTLALIASHGNGQLPRNAAEMAKMLQQTLEADGIAISAHTSATDPEIDVTVAGIDKSTGYKILRLITAKAYRMTEEEADKHFLTVGDSPDPEYNDESLLRCGIGVTNVGYLTPNGSPYVLDIPGDNIQRVRSLFASIKRMKRPKQNPE